jgi:hypothetical protein
METLLNPHEAAAALRLSPHTLKKLRVSGRGPRFIRANRTIRYRQSDLRAWLDGRVRQSTSDSEVGVRQ